MDDGLQSLDEDALDALLGASGSLRDSPIIDFSSSPRGDGSRSTTPLPFPFHHQVDHNVRSATRS